MLQLEPGNLPALLTRPEVAKLGESLGQNQVRLVGGCVRDALIGIEAADVDVCTPLTPDQVTKRLNSSSDFQVYPTGIKYGSVSARYVKTGKVLEVTTLRIDADTDGRHARVMYGRSWEEDAARRDFTINALMLDFEGCIHDYFDGKADLAAGRLCFIGEPSHRLAEDWLRALRYFRFWARFGIQEPDSGIRTALRHAAEHLGRLSVERVWAELKGLTRGTKFWAALALFDQLGFSQALGFRLHWPDQLPDIQDMEPAQIWGALLGGTAVDTLKGLHASSAEQASASAVAAALGSNESWFARQVRYGQKAARTAHRWSGGDGGLEPVPDFPVRAQDLLARGHKPGPALGKALDALKKKWIRAEGQVAREALLDSLSRSTT